MLAVSPHIYRHCPVRFALTWCDCASQYLEWGGALIGMLINLFWLSAPKPLKVTIYITLGWLVRDCRNVPVVSPCQTLSSAPSAP